MTWWTSQQKRRRLRPPRPEGRAVSADQGSSTDSGQVYRRARGTGHPRADPAPAPRRRAGLRHPPRIQRPHRSHTAASKPYDATPSGSEPDQLPHPLPAALRDPHSKSGRASNGRTSAVALPDRTLAHLHADGAVHGSVLNAISGPTTADDGRRADRCTTPRLADSATFVAGTV